MMFHTFSFFLSVILILKISKLNSLELKSTSFNCAGSYAELKCPKDYKIVIERIVNRYSISECLLPDPNSAHIENPLEHCVGIEPNDRIAQFACNGQQNCHLKMSRYEFKTHLSETNCNFTSNFGKIFYSCLPNFETQKYNYKSYDICDAYGPDMITDVENGFIHSPYYPDYYGNKQNCYIKISIPNHKRLVVYLVRRSLEGKSLLPKGVNDYLSIDNGVKYYGYSETPEIIYEGNDREYLTIRFTSDWITTSLLKNPKGFLIYFELFPIVETEITETTTTSTTTTTTSTTSTTHPPTQQESRFDEKIEKRVFSNDDSFSSISEKIENRHDIYKKDDERLVTIITFLIGLIGVLILIIFGLLLMFRSKQKQTEDDLYYESNKSVGTVNYNEDYQNVSIISTASLKTDLNKTQNSKEMSINKSEKMSSKFSDRLKKLYKNLNQTLNYSSHILNSTNTDNSDDLKINKEENMKKHFDSTKSNIYRINEFKSADIDVKFEKDIAIDKLKHYKSTPISKKTNIEREIELEQQKRDALNRTENSYVSIPISFSDNKNQDGKLEIYEVNFENNYAYLTPSNYMDKTENNSSNIQESDAEIYQSINEYGTYDCKELIDQFNKNSNDIKASQEKNQKIIPDDIYSTPNNKQAKQTNKLSFSDESVNENDNSVIKLLNQDDSETNA